MGEFLSFVNSGDRVGSKWSSKGFDGAMNGLQGETILEAKGMKLESLLPCKKIFKALGGKQISRFFSNFWYGCFVPPELFCQKNMMLYSDLVCSSVS